MDEKQDLAEATHEEAQDEKIPREPWIKRLFLDIAGVATTIIGVRERVNALVEENKLLRAKVERLAEIVAHQSGQLSEIDKRIEQAVKLQVLEHSYKQSRAEETSASRQRRSKRET